MQKMQCIKCENMILPTTAQQNDGLCAVCIRVPKGPELPGLVPIEYLEVRKKFNIIFQRRLISIVQDQDNLFSVDAFQENRRNLLDFIERRCGCPPEAGIITDSIGELVLHKSKKFVEIEKAVNVALTRYFEDESHHMMVQAPYRMGVFPVNTGWDNKIDSPHYYTPHNYFYHSVYRGSSQHLHVLPCYEYLIRRNSLRLLGCYRMLSEIETLFNKESLHPGYLDVVFVHMLTGNDDGCLTWANNDWKSIGVNSDLNRFVQIMLSVFKKN
jgi:hypothetical protein